MALHRLKKSRESGLKPMVGDVRGLGLALEKKSAPESEYFDPQKEMDEALWQRILLDIPKNPEELFNPMWLAHLDCLCRLAILFPERRAELKLGEEYWKALEQILKKIKNQTLQWSGGRLIASPFITFGLLFFPERMQAYRTELVKLINEAAGLEYSNLLMQKWLGKEHVLTNLKEIIRARLLIQKMEVDADDLCDDIRIFEIMKYLVAAKIAWNQEPDAALAQVVSKRFKAILAEARSNTEASTAEIAELFFNLTVLSCARVEFSGAGIKFIPQDELREFTPKVPEQPQQIVI